MEVLVREFLCSAKANALARRSITGLAKVCQPCVLTQTTRKSMVLGAFPSGRLGPGSLGEIAGAIV
jgi:hypothetical protein